MFKSFAALGAVALLACPAVAGEAGTITTDALYAGALADGLAKLEPLAAADDSEAWFGIGAIKLTQSIEQLSQALYRHGLAIDAAPNAFGVGVILPIPQNPNPELLDYAGCLVPGTALRLLVMAPPCRVAAPCAEGNPPRPRLSQSDRICSRVSLA